MYRDVQFSQRIPLEELKGIVLGSRGNVDGAAAGTAAPASPYVGSSHDHGPPSRDNSATSSSTATAARPPVDVFVEVSQSDGFIHFVQRVGVAPEEALSWALADEFWNNAESQISEHTRGRSIIPGSSFLGDPEGASPRLVLAAAAATSSPRRFSNGSGVAAAGSGATPDLDDDEVENERSSTNAFSSSRLTNASAGVPLVVSGSPTVSKTKIPFPKVAEWTAVPAVECLVNVFVIPPHGTAIPFSPEHDETFAHLLDEHIVNGLAPSPREDGRATASSSAGAPSLQLHHKRTMPSPAQQESDDEQGLENHGGVAAAAEATKLTQKRRENSGIVQLYRHKVSLMRWKRWKEEHAGGPAVGTGRKASGSRVG